MDSILRDHLGHANDAMVAMGVLKGTCHGTWVIWLLVSDDRHSITTTWYVIILFVARQNELLQKKKVCYCISELVSDWLASVANASHTMNHIHLHW